MWKHSELTFYRRRLHFQFRHSCKHTFTKATSFPDLFLGNSFYCSHRGTAKIKERFRFRVHFCSVCNGPYRWMRYRMTLSLFAFAPLSVKRPLQSGLINQSAGLECNFRPRRQCGFDGNRRSGWIRCNILVCPIFHYPTTWTNVNICPIPIHPLGCLVHTT